MGRKESGQGPDSQSTLLSTLPRTLPPTTIIFQPLPRPTVCSTPLVYVYPTPRTHVPEIPLGGPPRDGVRKTTLDGPSLPGSENRGRIDRRFTSENDGSVGTPDHHLPRHRPVRTSTHRGVRLAPTVGISRHHVFRTPLTFPPRIRFLSSQVLRLRCCWTNFLYLPFT